MNYGGSPKLDLSAPEDDESTMATLKQSDRVGSIGAHCLSTISEPFSELPKLLSFRRSRESSVPRNS